MGKPNEHLFTCPISVDVMKAPVSLCTGVSYDRASIQRWLDSGHDTCPATMQLLSSNDLIPNHTLHRIIKLSNPIIETRTRKQTLSLTFEKLMRFAGESTENRSLLGSNNSLLELLLRIVMDSDSDPDLLEPGVKLLEIISPKLSTVLRKSPGFLRAIARIVKSSPDLVIASTDLIKTIAPDSESKKTVFDDEELIPELLKVLNSYSDLDNGVVESILSALVSLSSPRRNKLKFVRLGGVKIVSKIVNFGSNAALELALIMLEMAAGSAEGRSAIVDEANCVAGVAEKLMKGSPSANEHGIALLWSLCYFFRDRRAKEEVLRSCNNGGLGFMKVLLLMQSDCSPVVKRMCCDLLRVFRVNSKSNCTIPSYDTKTTHIMPC